MIRGERLSLRSRHQDVPYEPSAHGGREHIERFDRDPHGKFVTVPYFESSDYSGGAVERSNRRVFIDEFSQWEGVEFWQVYGNFGYAGLVFLRDADERVPEIREALAALADYPILNEDDESQLEMDEENEAWEEYGRNEWRGWLNEHGWSRLPTIVRFLMQYHYTSTGLYQVLQELGDEACTRTMAVLVQRPPPPMSYDEWLYELDDSDLSNLWYDIVAIAGGAGEVVHEPGGVYFDFNNLFRWSEPSAGEYGELSTLAYAVLGVLVPNRDADVWLPADRMQVFTDFLLEQGGEWSDEAEEMLLRLRG